MIFPLIPPRIVVAKRGSRCMGRGFFSETMNCELATCAPGRRNGRRPRPHRPAAACAAACASVCSAALSIHRMRPIARPRFWRCGGSISIGCGGWSRRAIRSRMLRACAARRPARRGARTGPSSAYRRDRLRSRSRHQLHLCDHQLSRAALPGRAFRLDHGRRQSASLPSLAALARYRALVPIAVIDRLGPSLYSAASVAGQALAWARLPEIAARRCR